MKLKIFLFLVIAGLLVVPESRASSMSITLDIPNQSGLPGARLSFFGTIVNTGTGTVFLNGSGVNLAGTGFILTDLFFVNAPIFLDPGASSGDIELFNVDLMNPFSGPYGFYAGTYTLIGGVDTEAQDILEQVSFSVTANPPINAVPEPATVLLLTTGLLGLGAARRRRSSF